MHRLNAKATKLFPFLGAGSACSEHASDRCAALSASSLVRHSDYFGLPRGLWRPFRPTQNKHRHIVHEDFLNHMTFHSLLTHAASRLITAALRWLSLSGSGNANDHYRTLAGDRALKLPFISNGMHDTNAQDYC